MSDTTTTEPTMTPYAAAKLVNQQLKDMGITKQLPPQMLYTYVSKGYIKSTVVDGKKKVTNQALADWFVGYVEKLTNTKVAPATSRPAPSVWNFADLAESESE